MPDDPPTPAAAAETTTREATGAAVECEAFPDRPSASLTSAQITAIVARLTRGASLPSACATLGLSVASALAALRVDMEFRRQLRQVELMRTENVSAALYRKAMEGNVSAQTFLLRSRPPAEWQEDSPWPVIPDDLTVLTDEELDALLRDFAAALQRSSQA